jgi:predicted patatin/cPLA2 family phospholipase
VRGDRGGHRRPRPDAEPQRVYSMGALAALEDHGLREAFSVVSGSSSGAINGAYFLAGQANAAVEIYVEHLSNRLFVNPRRFWKIVDIDYMVDHALKINLPLDVESLRRSSSVLEITVTNAVTGQPRTLNGHDIENDIYEVIRATAALPALYNRRVKLADGYYVDGAASDTVPVMSALSTGVNGVLAVLTRSPGYRRGNHGFAYRILSSLMARGQSKAVRRLLGTENQLYNESMDLLEGKATRGGVKFWGVWPSEGTRLAKVTTFDKMTLRASAEMGRRDMEAVLKLPACSSPK